MRGELLIIAVDGTTARSPLTGADNLRALNEAVGGTIGFVPRFASFEGRECDAYVNDDGLFLGLPENPEATRLWLAQFGEGPKVDGVRLHGPPAIVTGDAEFMRASRDF